MRTNGRRITLAALVAAALGATVLLAGCGLGDGGKPTPTAAPTAQPTSALPAEPTAKALAQDIDGIVQAAQDGLSQEAIPDGIDAPDPTGASVDLNPLLTEAESMVKELDTPVPTLSAQ